MCIGEIEVVSDDGKVVCSVCLDPVLTDEGQRSFAKLQCGHQFHLERKKHMGIGEIEVISDDGKVVCSVCLDPVLTDEGQRSFVNLQCAHQFHFDCIGSAFNIKGAMQCPNCRKVEKGQWLFASASRSFPDVSMDDWVHDEDLYDLSYSETAFGVHWCPYNGLTRMPSAFDEVNYSAAAYHDLVNQHSIFEHTAASSASHPCPYIAYVGPVHPSSSSSSSSGGSVQDSGSGYNSHWNGGSGPSQVPASYGIFPAMEVHYHTLGEQDYVPFSSSSSRGGGGGADQPSMPSITHRQARPNSDGSRSGNYMHILPMSHSRSSGSRTGSSVTSSMLPPHPGSVARTRDRVQALQAYFQQPSNSRTPVIPGSRRSSNHRGYTQASSSDQSGGFSYYPSGSSGSRSALETDSHSLSNHISTWERENQHLFSFSPVDRDPIWGPPVARPRRGSDRMQSQNR